MELAINSDDEDKHTTAEDIKALINTLQLDASRILTTIVYAQAHQNFQFKDCFDQMQTQISSLTIDLDFMQAL